ncbi:Dyp-type peroxidase [Gordonia jinghuaiqii]|uniref:Dyp-type peroxidase n=1 Tax=Gordonia jinghuaiqii TaxID=2758710 RepID=A0A7D7LWV7_9ACTN|nr:Dyp-type peroxidase [Gordonia jinghuaiqii]MCR5979554.1 Dyp-type peroxidase [Gordonia jinghuaiqii]QMT00654.1 Dyp-type peroxidase [Gordonia jinghuaiqii]
MPDRQPPRAGLSRRRLLAGGAAALGATGIGAAAVTGNRAPARGAAVFGSETIPFYGAHQAGVATPPQAHALFIGLDLRPAATHADAVSVMRLWTADAARLTAGRPALADTEPELSATPARLTATIGFGPTFFDRLALDDRRPSAIRPLPPFGIDRLESHWGGTDLLLHLGCDDPTTLAHASRVLLKNVRSLTTIRWTQRGFRTARGAHPDGQTMRNLMGQVDGTVNPTPGTDLDAVVWATRDDQPWFAGGTSMVLRRIRIELDTWDELDPHSRDLSLGRRQSDGAPLTGTDEHDAPDFGATSAGMTVIPENAHIARAHPRTSSERFLRRAYNYDDPPAPGETSNAGLLFAAYQRDIDTQFLPVQQRLAEADALNQWITPIGSAVFAIPPGIEEGAYLGHQLLEHG